MRLGVLDVGSNTVHLLVVDAYQGARPLPAYSHKVELHLAQHLGPDGRISAAGAEALVRFVLDALVLAEDKGVEELLPFATSAIREAPNGEAVLAQVFAETGVRLSVLSGDSEARLTFLAVRRWFGWSSGRLLVFDIGGGSLEIAAGTDESPDTATSLPLGAGRLTRTWFSDDPPHHKEVRALRRYIRGEVARTVGPVTRLGHIDHAVATSKTFKQLARLTGAAPSSEGPHVRRALSRSVLVDLLPALERMSAARRATLPGVSPGRALQILAGALVADAIMDLFGLPELEICPWALREGVILRKLDLVAGFAEPPVARERVGPVGDMRGGAMLARLPPRHVSPAIDTAIDTVAIDMSAIDSEAIETSAIDTAALDAAAGGDSPAN